MLPKRLALTIFALAILNLSSGCKKESQPADKPVETPTKQITPKDDETPASENEANNQTEAEDQEASSDHGKPVVVIDTNMGDIVIELTPERTPVTVDNFLEYVDNSFYDNTIFHRVVNLPNALQAIQGGGYTADLVEKETRGTIENESADALSNTRGTIAMARQGHPDSATCQFFINAGNNAFLDADPEKNRPGYCVFGRVIEGMDTVDRIANVETTTKPIKTISHGLRPFEDVPVENVVIRTIRRK
jgi:cyclophilin family peptidyl-prolyl cis-trans isomerase